MKIGIESGAYLSRFGVKDGLRRMKLHGYDCLDYQGFLHTEDALFQSGERYFADTLKDFRACAEDSGIEISQVHGPWRYPPQDSTEALRNERFRYFAQAVRGAARLGCRRFVIHNLMPFGDVDTDASAIIGINFDFFSELLKVAEDSDVVICLENMPFPQQTLARPADTLRFVKQFRSPYMRMCLDTGHAAVLGESPADALRLLGKEYAAALHVHDNDGRSDLHLLPGEGVIDWQDFAAALHEIGFDGSVSLETAARGDTPEALERNQLALISFMRRLVTK